VASRAHRLNQGLATADCAAAAVAAVSPRAFQALAGPGAARAPRSGAAAAGGRTPAPTRRPARLAAAACAARSGCLLSPAL